jgi:hypothetical protein
MVDEEEWRWIDERSSGDFDRLLLALSDPLAEANLGEIGVVDVAREVGPA